MTDTDHIREFIRSLIRPPLRVTGEYERRKAALITGVLLIVPVVMFVTVILVYIVLREVRAAMLAELPLYLSAFIASVVVYGIARAGFPQQAALAGSAVYASIIFLIAFPEPGATIPSGAFVFLSLVIFNAAALIGVRAGIGALIALVFGILLMAQLYATLGFDASLVYYAAVQVTVIGIVGIIVIVFRNNLDRFQRQQLAEREAQLRLITDNMSEWIAVSDLQGTLTYASPNLRRLLNQQTHVGLTLMSAFRSPDQRAIRACFDAVAAGSGPATLEFRWERPDGPDCWMEASMTLAVEPPAPPQIIIVVRDIHARKQAEASVQQQRALLRTLIDSLPDLIYMKDRQGRFLLVNQTYVGFMGFESEDDLLGKTIFDLYPEPIARAFAAQDERVYVTGEPNIEENFDYTLEGVESKWVISKMPLRDASGTLIGLVGISRNITFRARLDAAERERESLQIALEQEKELGALKNLFMITVSHEFRTPLATMMAASELLRDYWDKLSAERRLECVTAICTEVLHLRSMLDDIGALMSLQLGAVTREWQPVDLPAFLDTVIGAVNLPQEARRPVHVETAEAARHVHADPTLLTQMLAGLLRNAMQYSPPDATIQVSARPESDGWLHIDVCNPTSPLPEDEFARIFDPFFRGSNSQGTPGSGVGLTIVRQTAQAYGGVITASQRADRLCFTLRLPLPESSTVSAADQSAAG